MHETPMIYEKKILLFVQTIFFFLKEKKPAPGDHEPHLKGVFFALKGSDL